MKIQPYSLLLAGALTFLTPLGVKAATIEIDSSHPSDLEVASVGEPGGPGLEGYDIFNTQPAGTGTTFGGTDISNLAGSYATFTPGAGVGGFSAGDGSELQIGSTNYQTGFYYGGSATQVLGTIALSNDAPSSFILGLLTDNNGNTYNYTTYSLSISGDSTNTAAEITPAYEAGKNNFYYLLVTDGAGQTITITGNNTAINQPLIGGITFDVPASAPEPSTYALVLGGLGLLALVRRFRATRV